MIRSTRALIIYTAAMLGALASAAFTTIGDAVVISFFTSLTGFFTAYIVRRYYKEKLKNGN